MKKYILMLVVLTSLILVAAGCLSKDKTTYVICHGVASTQGAEDYWGEGDVYGHGRLPHQEFSMKQNLYVFKKLPDGSYIPVEGVWKVEPDNIAYFEDYTTIHNNYLVLVNPGRGKISAYVPEANVTVERNLFIYDIIRVDAFSGGEHPQSLDFDQDSIVDVSFEPNAIICPKIWYQNWAEMKDIIAIPTDGYMENVTISDWDIVRPTCVIQTSSGKYAKFTIGMMQFDANKNVTPDIIYYYEPNSTTTFEY